MIFDRLEFFTPGSQFWELFICHFFRWTLFKQIFKVSVNIQIMRPGHLDHRINNGAGIGSIDRIAEQPVFSSYRKRADRIFTQIVCKAAASVFQILSVVRGLCWPWSADRLLFHLIFCRKWQSAKIDKNRPAGRKPTGRRFEAFCCFEDSIKIWKMDGHKRRPLHYRKISKEVS